MSLNGRTPELKLKLRLKIQIEPETIASWALKLYPGHTKVALRHFLEPSYSKKIH